MRNSELKLSSVSVLFAAHLINDMYTNFLPQLVAVLIAFRTLSVGAGSALVAVFTISSSVVQPVFGYLVDQKGQRWLLFVGTLWMALLLGSTGYISNYPLLFIVSALSGLGTAAFHPQAAAMVGQASDKNKGLVMSSFIAMGTIGLALSPLLLLPLFHTYGTKYTWLAFFPGILATILLYRYAPRVSKEKNNGPKLSQALSDLKKSSTELTKLMLVVALRSLTHTGLMTLLPVYFLSQKLSSQNTGLLMFATLIAGAVGGIIGGYISDRFGRKPLIVSSLIMASIFFNGFLLTKGLLSIALLVLGGMALLSSFSVTVVIAQEIIPENKALASGLSLGFAIGIGGLAVSLIGKYAEIFSLSSAIHLLFYIPLFAGLMGLSLKGTIETHSCRSKTIS